MATIKAILYESKTLSNGEHPIMLRITAGNKRKYISIGFSCTKIMWDDDASLPKRKYQYYYDVQAIVNRKKDEISAELYKIKFDNKRVDIVKLARNATGSARNKVKLLEYFKEVSARLRGEGRVGYANAFKYTGNSLKKHMKGEDTYMIHISAEFLEAYEKWLANNAVSLVSRSMYFRTFRTLFRIAIKEELIPDDAYPFKKFAFAKYNDPETSPRALPKEKIQELFSLSLKQNSKAFHSLNYFKFSYYSYGMNFIDFAKLKWVQINNGLIEYYRTKTKKKISVAILPQAQEILNYYKENHTCPFGFVFPILKEDYSDPIKMHDKIVEKRVDYNEGLAQLQELISTPVKLSSYVARHSFAYNCYVNGVEKKVIGESLGHHYEAMTNKYIGQLDKNYVSQTILKALE